MPALYAPDLRKVEGRDQSIALLECVVDEPYGPHAQLNTPLEGSSRLVPSGADLWAEWRNGDATITQVRDDTDASRAGLRPGSVVTAIDGASIADAVEAGMGRSYDHSLGLQPAKGSSRRCDSWNLQTD